MWDMLMKPEKSRCMAPISNAHADRILYQHWQMTCLLSGCRKRIQMDDKYYIELDVLIWERRW